MSEASSSDAACPDENTLVAYLDGVLSPDDEAAVRLHLDGCEDCWGLVTWLVRDTVPFERDAELETLPRGTNLGRYIVVDPIGRGAMGAVYSAFDPELDRKVAVKVLRADRPGADSRSLLLAEAQAMARLSHPAVISVFDVGAHADGIFIAMELVHGKTLRAAVEGSPRTWRRTLAFYRTAGEGLAAAHAAGVIHRDFKPDNVLVGDDGRVRVTDFGLARSHHVVPEKRERAGTPAYMAPEIWRGEPATARSDQYAFCVALYEGLHGARPSRADVQGRAPPRAATPPANIPPAVDRVIERGLHADPAKRWESMDALLHALTFAARRWNPTGLALTAALALVAVLAWTAHENERTRLNRLGRELDIAAHRAPQLFAAQHDLLALRISGVMKKDAVMNALARASDMDAAMGLAKRDESEQELAEAHEVMRSADLSELKSADALVFVNAWGRIIFNLADEARFGARAPAAPIVAHALDSAEGEELWSPQAVARWGAPFVKGPPLDGDLVLVSAHPLVRGQTLVGAVVVGQRLKGAFLSSLERVAGFPLTLHAPDHAWTGAPMAQTPPVAPGVRFITTANPPFVAATARLEDDDGKSPQGWVTAVRPVGNPKSDWASPIVRWGTLVLAVFATLLTAWRAWRLA